MNLLGGKARTNGVTFETDLCSATAIRKGENIIVIKNIKDNTQTKFESYIHNIPFIRAYLIILKILFSRFGLLIIAFSSILTYFYFLHRTTLNNTSGHNYICNIIIFLIFILQIRCTNKSYYHGAEHKVVNDYEKNNTVSLESAMKESRVNNNCGTNFFVGFYLIVFILYLFIHSWAFLIGWGIIYELLGSENKLIKIITRPIYFLGGLLQKYILTKEPNRDQLEVAIKAFKVLENN